MQKKYIHLRQGCWMAKLLMRYARETCWLIVARIGPWLARLGRTRKRRLNAPTARPGWPACFSSYERLVSTNQRDGSLHVAVLVDTATGWGRRLVRGVLRYSAKRGPWHFAIGPKGQADYLSLPYSWQGHGVIARIGSSRMIRELQEAEVPVINVSAIELPHNPFPRVTTDYDGSAALAMEHFLARGFCQFAYSGLERFAYGKMHRQAFCDAVRTHGYTCHVQPNRSHRRTKGAFEKNLAATIEWLMSLPKPVGVFTWATDRGRELLEACRVAGISVPYEVAVLSGDYDELLCDASTPPLSSVNVSSEQIGYIAAQMLDELMHGRRLRQTDVRAMPAAIVERPSTDTLAIDDPDVVQALEFIRARCLWRDHDG